MRGISWRSCLATLSTCAFVLCSDLASAQIPVTDLSRALSRLPDGGENFLRNHAASGKNGGLPVVPLLLDLAPGLPPPPDALWITDHLHVVYAAVNRPTALAQFSKLGKLSLSNRLFPSMSLAHDRISADRAATDYGIEGSGSVVGIVDTGADLTHPALRHADGSTRVLWMLAYGQIPRGTHAELEEEYGCNDYDPCAVYDETDINAILQSQNLDGLPQDRIGHGTHIASIAAGLDKNYPGIAPQADLMVVAAADDSGGVFDSRILLGARFIFERARERQQAAVINVSLGSSFGAHDGTSELERGLESLAQGPGRAIVVAAGNSGARYLDLFPKEYGPFGSHAQYAVTESAPVVVPILQYSSKKATISGAIYVWIATDPGDQLRLAFVTKDDEVSDWIKPGEASALNSDSWGDPDTFDVAVLNGSGDSSELEVPEGSVVIAIAGQFASDRKFEFVLGGSATARMWATGIGDAAYGASSLGPIFPRAQGRGTIQIPATAPSLIAVGSTINRLNWTDYSGDEFTDPQDPGTDLSTFSSVGPNLLAQLKPELVAPGEGVIAAMARAADPRGDDNTVSQFDDYGSCPSDVECYVIDDDHGIASGTSMAAPMVTGTIALLMQRDRELTMEKARAYLMSGAYRFGASGQSGGWGTGEVDVVGALLAQEADLAQASPVDQSPVLSAQTSYVVWADSLVHPAPAPGLIGQVLLRDAEGRPRPVSKNELKLEVTGPGSGELKISGPGMVEVKLTAQAGSAFDQLGVRLTAGDVELFAQTLDINLDPVRDEHGYALTGGTCSWTGVTRGQSTGANLAFWLLSSLLVLARRKRTYASDQLLVRPAN